MHAQAFYTNFLDLIRDDQLIGCEAKQGEGGQSCPDAALAAGSIADVTPFTTGPYGAFPGSVVWQSAYPVITYNTWKAYGDMQLISRHWDGLVALSDYWSRQPCAQDHQNLCGGLGDWVDTSWPARTTDAQVCVKAHRSPLLALSASELLRPQGPPSLSICSTRGACCTNSTIGRVVDRVVIPCAGHLVILQQPLGGIHVRDCDSTRQG
eukprot:COSAG02_NODE_2945_length_7687_cov_25.192541_7_plen_209_part_00